MRIVVNGQPHSVEPGVVLATLLPADRAGIAVAVNAEVVPRAEHGAVRLSDGDVVEIVTAVQGG